MLRSPNGAPRGRAAPQPPADARAAERSGAGRGAVTAVLRRRRPAGAAEGLGAGPGVERARRRLCGPAGALGASWLIAARWCPGLLGPCGRAQNDTFPAPRSLQPKADPAARGRSSSSLGLNLLRDYRGEKVTAPKASWDGRMGLTTQGVIECHEVTAREFQDPVPRRRLSKLSLQFKGKEWEALKKEP
ncbi:collagen alpha-2(I) chain-like [Rhea pennata]|uniref:collagen alpha-2(I) chain-like n=1 Tax=Rhea pennata TaxID=8795 RepID=UPI002E273AA8